VEGLTIRFSVYFKVDLNVEDNEGRFPLHLAAAYSSKNIVKVGFDFRFSRHFN